MQNRFIVRMNDGNLLCFFYEDGNIFVKEIKNGACGNKEIIANEVRKGYTVNLCESGEIYLFCQSVCGDIIHLRFRDGKWNKNVVLKNNGKGSKDIIFYCVEKNSKMNLIYNIPDEHSNSCDIMKQSFDGRGWGVAEKIDTAVCMNDFIFKVQMTDFGCGIIFYQRKGRNGENSIGYREFNIDGVGEYNLIYATTYKIGGTSFLSTKEDIHFVFVVKNIFSSRIIYRKKDSNVINEHIIIGEAQQIENCELFIVKNRIYIFWKGVSGVFYCFSDNFGKSFSKPYKYSQRVCQSIRKAFYLSFLPMKSEEFFVRSVYTDRLNVCDIQILPELYEKFILKEVQNENFEKNENVQNEPKNSDVPVEETIVEVLKNQVNMLNSQMIFKNKQIEQLTASLQRKNEEIIFADKNWKERYKKAVLEKEFAQKELEEVKIKALNYERNMKAVGTKEEKVKEDLEKIVDTKEEKQKGERAEECDVVDMQEEKGDILSKRTKENFQGNLEEEESI